MVTADDLETDFEGAIRKLADEARREIEAIPEAERDDYLTMQASARLGRMLAIKAPAIVIEMLETSLAKRLRRRAKARRQSAAEKST